jgi:hypothetical protein
MRQRQTRENGEIRAPDHYKGDTSLACDPELSNWLKQASGAGMGP